MSDRANLHVRPNPTFQMSRSTDAAVRRACVELSRQLHTGKLLAQWKSQTDWVSLDVLFDRWSRSRLSYRVVQDNFGRHLKIGVWFSAYVAENLSADKVSDWLVPATYDYLSDCARGLELTIPMLSPPFVSRAASPAPLIAVDAHRSTLNPRQRWNPDPDVNAWLHSATLILDVVTETLVRLRPAATGPPELVLFPNTGDIFTLPHFVKVHRGIASLGQTERMALVAGDVLDAVETYAGCTGADLRVLTDAVEPFTLDSGATFSRASAWRPNPDETLFARYEYENDYTGIGKVSLVVSTDRDAVASRTEWLPARTTGLGTRTALAMVWVEDRIVEWEPYGLTIAIDGSTR